MLKSVTAAVFAGSLAVLLVSYAGAQGVPELKPRPAAPSRATDAPTGAPARREPPPRVSSSGQQGQQIVISELPPATLTVRQVTIPTQNAERFDLLINGIVYAKGVKGGGTTSAVTLPPGNHQVSLVSSHPDSYTHHVFSGDCDASGLARFAPPYPTTGLAATCTITSTAKPFKSGSILFQDEFDSKTFSVCAFSNCVLNGYPGEQITVTIEAWGFGGDGQDGKSAFNANGKKWPGRPAAGGGSGAYARTQVTLTVPVSGAITYWVRSGRDAYGSRVRLNNSEGALVLAAGSGEDAMWDSWTIGGRGGVAPTGPGITVVQGTAGGDVGDPGKCGGGSGGSGGAAGPGGYGRGGAGGGGGYLNSVTNPTCTKQSLNNGWSKGEKGGKGGIRFTW